VAGCTAKQKIVKSEVSGQGLTKRKFMQRGVIHENYNLQNRNSKIKKSKGAVDMNIEKNMQPPKKETQEPFRFKKRHGSTTFYVAVYSKQDAKETAQDKITRLIRNDCEHGDAKIGKAGN